MTCCGAKTKKDELCDDSAKNKGIKMPNDDDAAPLGLLSMPADDNGVQRRASESDPLADPHYLPSVVNRYQQLVTSARTWLATAAEETVALDNATSVTHSNVVEQERRAALVKLLQARLPMTSAELNRRYRRVVKIGEGSFGDVFIAFDVDTQTYCTVKRMRDLVHERRNRDRSLSGVHLTVFRELQILQLCDHPNILPLIDYQFMEDGACLMFMPVVSHDLSGLTKLWRRPMAGQVHRIPQRDGCLMPLSYVKCILTQILEGLSYLHRCGIWHRDLKLSNVLVHHDGTVLLIDFGWARFEPMTADEQRALLGADTVSPKRLLTGPPCTLPFRPPEVLIGAPSQHRYHGVSVDMWAFGCLAFELLTGELLVPPQKVATEVEALHRLVDLLGPPAQGLPLFQSTSNGVADRIYIVKEANRTGRGVQRGSLGSVLDRYRLGPERSASGSSRTTSPTPPATLASAPGATTPVPPSEPTAYDFLCEFLKWDPSRRMSARRALEHPWLRSTQPLPVPKGEMVLPSVNTYHFLMSER